MDFHVDSLSTAKWKIKKIFDTCIIFLWNERFLHSEIQGLYSHNFLYIIYVDL